MGLLWQGALHHCVFKLQCSHMLFCKCTAFSCCIHNIFILQVCKVRMGPSSYFLAGDVVKDNIILIAYANSGVQAAVVINSGTWVGHKQAGDDPDVPAWWWMLDSRVIQVQRMPRTRLGTCPNGPRPWNEWPLLASQTSLWDLSDWTVDAMIDHVMQSHQWPFWAWSRKRCWNMDGRTYVCQQNGKHGLQSDYSFPNQQIQHNW